LCGDAQPAALVYCTNSNVQCELQFYNLQHGIEASIPSSSRRRPFSLALPPSFLYSGPPAVPHSAPAGSVLPGSTQPRSNATRLLPWTWRGARREPPPPLVAVAECLQARLRLRPPPLLWISASPTTHHLPSACSPDLSRGMLTATFGRSLPGPPRPCAIAITMDTQPASEDAITLVSEATDLDPTPLHNLDCRRRHGAAGTHRDPGASIHGRCHLIGGSCSPCRRLGRPPDRFPGHPWPCRSSRRRDP
jgi:hypothetical protein